MNGKMLYCMIFTSAMVSSSFAQSVWEWRNPLPQGNDLYEVAYGNNLFIAVGSVGTILTSPNGITWTERSASMLFNALLSVTYGNNQFIAVGGGTILTSPDGAIWTEQSLGITKRLRLNSVTYGNNQFIAVGEDGTIISSKADATTGVVATNLDSKSTQQLSMTTISNRLFIQIPTTKHVGNDVKISLFNAAGQTVCTTTMKMTARTFIVPITGLSQGAYLVKITSGNGVEYSGTVAITR